MVEGVHADVYYECLDPAGTYDTPSFEAGGKAKHRDVGYAD